MSELVEVLSANYRDKHGGGEAPSGSMSLFDGRRGQVIYRRRRGQTAVSSSQKLPSHSTAQTGKDNPVEPVELVLTGPSRPISAYGCVTIKLDLHHGCKNRALYVAEILLDVYDPSTVYNKAVTAAVRTCTCSDAPLAQVKYALLSDAVEAVVMAKLLTREQDDDTAGCCFYLYRITAISDIGDVVLFRSDDESPRIGASDGPMTIIPLARSVLAVPLTSPLTIDMELGDRSGGEMVKFSKRCHPDLDYQQVLSFACEIGTVEVKITCSD